MKVLLALDLMIALLAIVATPQVSEARSAPANPLIPTPSPPPIIVFVIDPQGLMYNLSLEGSKISRITR
jgi:hypothetical protein